MADFHCEGNEPKDKKNNDDSSKWGSNKLYRGLQKRGWNVASANGFP